MDVKNTRILFSYISCTAERGMAWWAWDMWQRKHENKRQQRLRMRRKSSSLRLRIIFNFSVYYFFSIHSDAQEQERGIWEFVEFLETTFMYSLSVPCCCCCWLFCVSFPPLIFIISIISWRTSPRAPTGGRRRFGECECCELWEKLRFSDCSTLPLLEREKS